MAAKSKQLFEFVAHIQRGSKVTEVAGTREEYSMKRVYTYLLGLAEQMGGFLLADSIKPCDIEAASESRCAYNEKEETPSEEQIQLGPRIGDVDVWVPFTVKYTGATRLTFKEDK